MYFDFVYGIHLDTKEKSTANLRKLARIAFSLRSGALLRLIAYAESHPLLINAIRKARVRVFLLFHNILISQKEKLKERKTGTPVFPQHFSKRRAILRRRSAGAEHGGAERGGARKMRFARIRGGVQAEGLRAASNEQSSFGLIRG